MSLDTVLGSLHMFIVNIADHDDLGIGVAEYLGQVLARPVYAAPDESESDPIARSYRACKAQG